MFSEVFELVWRDPSVDGEVVACWLEVLSDGEDVAGVAGVCVLSCAACAVVFACAFDDFVHEVEDFVVSFADADHDAGFGDAALLFDTAEEFDGAFELCAWAYGWVHAFYAFDVVVDDVRFGVDDGLECVPVALEVWDEDFDGHARACVDGSSDGVCPDGGAAVLEFVAVDACDDDVFEVHECE